MKKNAEQVKIKNVELESSDWSDIHKDFAQKWYGKTYQQMWEENGLTRQDAQEWINSGFKPRDYSAVKRWKGQEFPSKEACEWIKVGFRPSEDQFVAFLKEKGYQPGNTNPKEMREKFVDWFKEREGDAQTYLDREYPLSERKKIVELDVSKKNLTGSLKLEGFSNLTIFDCSVNQLVSFEEFLPYLNFDTLTWLSIGDNVFPRSDNDLTIFRVFVNLRGLNIGSPYQKRVHWTGSFQPLQPLTKLEYLDIKNADLIGGLGYLSESLTEFYCGGTKLAEELEAYGSPNNGNYIDSGKNYINLLLEWRKEHEQQKNQLEAQIQTPSKI